jgi:hypothetical protein
MTQVRGRLLVAALAVGVLSVLGVTGLTRILTPTGPEEAPKPARKLPARLFRGWEKPELALVLSGEQHGYLLPCGCSRPQVGGLERRYNFLSLLRQKGWPTEAVDLGDVPQHEGPRKLPNVQGLIKYRYSMMALKKMDYLAVGLGEYEAGLSLFSVLGEYALNDPSPAVVAANLRDKDTLYPEQVKSFVTRTPKGSRLKVGVAGILGASLGKKLRPMKVELDDNRKVVPVVLAGLAKAKTDLNVLLYQGTMKEAKALAAAHKEFHVIVCLSFEDEPPSEPAHQGNTAIVMLGHKGRYAGVLGVYPTGRADRPYDFRYQLVSLGEEFMTPAGEQEKQPVLALMEQYTRELKQQDYLGKYGQVKHPNQVVVPGVVPTYVGSEKCKKCHESAYEVWKGSKHSHAYETLADAKQPSLRQYDAECIVCHTVGFGYQSGYKNEKETPLLRGVGCESCHGPASEHVREPKSDKWHALLNPWHQPETESKEQRAARKLRIDGFCQSCHDIDNDVKYKFEKRWPDIDHPSPGR